jgi:hypothetical protein
VLDRFCIPCHNNKLKTAGLALDELDPVRVGRDADVWEKVAHKLRTQMPPPAGRRPDPETAARAASSLETRSTPRPPPVPRAASSSTG